MRRRRTLIGFGGSWRLPFALLALGVASDSRALPATVVISAPSPVDLARLSWAPPEAARRLRVGRSGWPEIAVDATRLGAALELRAPGACPSSIPKHELEGGRVTSVALTPWFSIRGENPQVGYDAPFELTLEPRCAEASDARAEWRPAGIIRDLAISADGRTLRGRTPSFETAHPADVPWGIVPLSPRTRGEIELEVRQSDRASSVTRRVRVAAAARATGIPIVSPGHRLLLGGAGWHVKERADPGRAEVVPSHPPTFEPDAVGRWVLADGAGRLLALTVGRHAQIRLDCGRSECHSRATAEATGSRMTSVLARGLTGELGPDYSPECAIACHAVGEPGLADGGFVNVARALGYILPPHPQPDLWQVVPRPLRRLAGVGCTACHGPAAIPEPESRWAVLRSDVCAVCHDAPPRYRHLAAWNSSRMASADRATRGQERSAGCDDCHGVVGFLARIGVREASPPRDPLGITCAACHAPHGPSSDHALLRTVKLSSRFDALDPARDAATRLCIACHATLGGEALLWWGDEGSKAPHREVPGGCIGCHMRAGTADGSGHAFRADRAACASCHAALDERAVPGGRIADRARSVWGRLAGLGVVASAEGGAPPHALGVAAIRSTRAPLQRAARNALLVLEDPAAWVHNGPFARDLLDEAERLLDAAQR